MSQPPKKRELVAQLLHLHRVYGRRLVVLSRILRDIAGPDSQRLAEHCEAAVSHNERWERFLSDDADRIQLANEKWDVEQAKQVYRPLIRLILSDPSLHCVFKDGPEIVHQIIENHNAAVCGNDYDSYFYAGTFPTFIFDHFINVRRILEVYDTLEHTTMFENILEFLLWLDRKVESLWR